MGSLSCPFCCGGSHTTEDNLRDHLMYVLYKPDRCPICRDDYFYPNKLEFIKHFIKKHKEKGSSERKTLSNPGGFVSIATSGDLQKDLNLLQARNILYQRDENQRKSPPQEHSQLAEVCKDSEEKKKGCKVPDERGSHIVGHQQKVLEAKEFSLETHRIQVEESLGLKLLKCPYCVEMIRGQSSYLKHIQEQHLKKSHFSTNNDSVNPKIIAFSQHTKSLGMSSPQFQSCDNNSPKSVHALSLSPSSSSHSPQLQQQYSPVSSSAQVPPPSSSSPVLCRLKNPSSPSLMSPMQQGEPSMPSQIQSPSGTWDKSWTPTISENSQERKQSHFLPSSNIDTDLKIKYPDRKNSGSPLSQKNMKKDTDESLYGDAGSWIPRNWYLDKTKVKGPLTPGGHSVRSGGSQTPSVNSPAPSEQSIISGKSWMSSVNSPASSEPSGRERFSYTNSPASSEFSYKSGKNLSSFSINSPAPSEQSIAPSPLSFPRYLESNPFSVQEPDDFRNLYHMDTVGNSAKESLNEQNEKLFKDESLQVKDLTSCKMLLVNKNVDLPLQLQKTTKEHQDEVHISDNQQISNVHTMDKISSTFNQTNLHGEIFMSHHREFFETHHRESDDFISSVTNMSPLDTESYEIKLKGKNVIPQSKNKTYSSSDNTNVQLESNQNENILNNMSSKEPKITNLCRNILQEPQSLQVDNKDIENDQNSVHYSNSSPESLYKNVENPPSISSVPSPLLSDYDICDLPHQDEPIHDIEKVVVDVEFSFDDHSHSQPLITQTEEKISPNPLIMDRPPQTISQDEFDLLESIPRESLVELHRDQMVIDSVANISPKGNISKLSPNRLEASILRFNESVSPNIEEQSIPVECTIASQEAVPSTNVTKSQTTFLSEDTNSFKMTHDIEKTTNRSMETESEEYADNIVLDNTQNLQEQERGEIETKVYEEQNKLDNILVVAKMEPEIIKLSTESESKMSMSPNAIEQYDESMVQDDDDDDDFCDLGLRVGRENMSSYPHKKFRPYEQDKNNMQSLTVSVCPDQERNNMQSLTLAKLNRTFDMDPSEETIDRKDHKYEGKEECLIKTHSYQFICEVCGQGFQNQSDYKIHYNSHEMSHTLFSSNETLEKVSRKRSKLLIEKKQLHKCDQCSKAFKKKYTLVRHHEEVHGTNKSFVCDFCNKEFSTKRSLENHADTHLTEKSHKCPQCPHVCQTAGGLRSHISEIHTNIKTKKGEIKCNYPDCQEKFSKMYGLKRHIARKHSISPSFFCIRCPSKVFSCKEDLNNHSQSHTNSDAMRCKECNKQFKSFWALQRHKHSHDKDSDNKFKCFECSQEFTRKDSLVTHTNAKHAIKKSHECETCGQKFVRKNQLQVHQKKKSHTAEPQISCDYCSKTFRFKDSYKRHIHPSDASHVSACTGLYPRVVQDEEKSGIITYAEENFLPNGP